MGLAEGEMRFGQSVLFILIIYSLLSLPCPLSFPHYIFLPLVTTVDAEYSDENTKKGQILPIFASKDKYLNVNSAFVYIFLLDALISLLKQSQVTGLIGSFCAPVI